MKVELTRDEWVIVLAALAGSALRDLFDPDKREGMKAVVDAAQKITDQVKAQMLEEMKENDDKAD